MSLKRQILMLTLISLGLACQKPQLEPSKLQLVRSEASITTAPMALRRSTVLIDVGRVQYCSGVIVAEDRILTAAHCFRFWRDGNNVIIRFGPDIRDLRYGRVAVNAVRVHDRYDLAVIEINKIPGSYAPIKIAEPQAALDVGDEAVIAGYGETASDRRDYAKFLRWGHTRFVETHDEIHYPAGFGFTTESVLAFYADDAAMSCKGDSGGPVLIKQNDEWRLTGIISGRSNLVCEEDGQTFAADPRPVQDWIFADFPNVEPPFCQIANNRPDSDPVILRYFGDGAATKSVVFQSELLSVAPKSRVIRDNLPATLTAYIALDDISCGAQPDQCLSTNNIKVIGHQHSFDGMVGAQLYRSPNDRSEPVGLALTDTSIKIIDRMPDGWLRVELTGILPQEFCAP